MDSENLSATCIVFCYPCGNSVLWADHCVSKYHLWQEKTPCATNNFDSSLVDYCRTCRSVRIRRTKKESIKMKLLKIAIAKVVLYLVFVFCINAGLDGLAFFAGVVLLLATYILILTMHKKKYISWKIILLWFILTIVEFFVTWALFHNTEKWNYNCGFMGFGCEGFAMGSFVWGILNVLFVILLLLTNFFKALFDAYKEIKARKK